MVTKPKHKEATNFEHCCSCCNVLEKENKQLKERNYKLEALLGMIELE